MLNPRENWMKMHAGEMPDYVPMTNECYAIVGVPTLEIFEQPWFQDGVDPYGVSWRVDSFGATPDTTKPPICDDITEWRDCVTIPSLDHVNIKEMAEEELKKVNRDEKVIMYTHNTGVYERLLAVMGDVGALCALVEDPEACMDFMDAVTDYKIKVAEMVYDAYHPDIYVNFDDVATAKGLFISPETYRSVVKPSHAKFIKAIKDMGMIPSEHTCGKCEELLDDYVEIGVEHWHSAQIMNDLEGITKKYKGKLTIEGGWDTSGKPGMIDCTHEEARAETRRAVEAYGGEGDFVLLPILVNENGHSLYVHDDRMADVFDEWEKCRMLK